MCLFGDGADGATVPAVFLEERADALTFGVDAVSVDAIAFHKFFLHCVSTALGELAIDVLVGESSPLYARLYSQGLINGSFGSSYDILPGAAYVYLGGDSNDPHAVVRAVLDEAQRLVREGLDQAYYLRLRNANFGTALKALNSFENIAVSMAEGKFLDYDPYRFPEVYDTITAEDVLDFIRENLVEERCAVSIIDPISGETKE